MTNGANLILGAVQPTIAAAKPVTNLLGGIESANLLQRQALQNQLLGQQVAQAPLRKQLLEQQVSGGDIQNKLRSIQLQVAMDSLDASDVPTLEQIAFDTSILSRLPDDQKIEFAQRMKANAQLSKRKTENIDDFIAVFQRDPEAGNALLEASMGAFSDLGLVKDVADERSIENRKLELRERSLELERQREQRQSSKLSAASEKALIESQDKSTEAGRNASEFKILADQVSSADFEGGVVSSFSEMAARLLGSQDEVTELRRRFNKVRLSEGLKNLPPGPATDRDVQEAFKGVPPENAPASQVVSFLRGAEKMAKFDQAWHEFRSEYISENNNTKGLIPAWKAHAKTIASTIAPDTRSKLDELREKAGL